MKRAAIIFLTILLALPVLAQFKGRNREKPITISVARTVSYHVQNIDLETNVQSYHNVYQLVGEDLSRIIVKEGESVVDEYQVDGQYLRFTEQSNGLEATVEAKLFEFFGLGTGFQYNFDARDRMKAYLKAYAYLSEKREIFNLLPTVQAGWKQFYTGSYIENLFYIGPSVDFDLRICRESTFFFTIRAGLDYYWNNEKFIVEENNGHGTIQETCPVPRNENLILYGGLGLKYQFLRR